jgi:hypothetical protein
VDFGALYNDLYRIARHVGVLDAAAVADARALLLLPRYSGASDPAEALAHDLREAIRSIPADEQLGSASPTDDDGEAGQFRQAAELYFSVQHAGESLVARRKLMHQKHGTADKWMNRAVISRVLLHLLELDHVASKPAADAFCIDELRVVAASTRVRVRATVTLDYSITLLQAGIHCLALPLPHSSTKLLHPWSDIGARLLTWESDFDTGPPVVMFGLGEKAGTQLHFSARHIDKARAYSMLDTAYFVDRPLGRLVLQVGDRHTWTYDAPTVGETYYAPQPSPYWDLDGANDEDDLSKVVQIDERWR